MGIYLYGASGHAKVIMDIINDNVNVNVPVIKGLFDDDPEVKELEGIPVVHEYHGEEPMIISIGNNSIRKRLVEKLGDIEYATAIHPSAIISPKATIDKGTVVMPGAIINSGARIGKHCIVNTGAAIDHECMIGDYAHISPHATLCGNVQVGEGAWIGAGATVIPGIKIGRWAVIGAGSVVVRDIPDGVTAFGNPCKIKRER